MIHYIMEKMFIYYIYIYIIIIINNPLIMIIPYDPWENQLSLDEIDHASVTSLGKRLQIDQLDSRYFQVSHLPPALVNIQKTMERLERSTIVNG